MPWLDAQGPKDSNATKHGYRGCMVQDFGGDAERRKTRNGGRFPGIPEGGCLVSPIQGSRGDRRRAIRTKNAGNGRLHRAGDLHLGTYVNAGGAN